MKPKILFIARNYPPRLGGLEAYCFNLIERCQKDFSVYKITLSKSRIHLLWFIPYSFFQALYLVRRFHINVVYVCDGLMATVGLLLKKVARVKVAGTIHGLDITYKNRFYQWVVRNCVTRLDRVICVSNATRQECIDRGIPPDRCRVIPNGISPNAAYIEKPKPELRLLLGKQLGHGLGDKKLLVSVGRLVKRKGVLWFVENVMSRLDSGFLYIIAGNGPEYAVIQDAIRRLNLEDRVLMTGRVTDETRNLLYNAADMFIMPNITVSGDVEGFGIAIIEAGSCGLPVVASDIQGIRDAVIDGLTGYRVREGDVEGVLERIRTMDLDRHKVRAAVIQSFDWDQIYRRYVETLFQCGMQEKALE